jgi:hypothetical protein
MNNEHDIITGELEEEKLLAHLKNVDLLGIGRGNLSLTEKRIEFQRRGGFLSPPRTEFSIELAAVLSARVRDELNTLILEWLDDAGETVVAQLNLPEIDDATDLCKALTRKLKVLRQVAELQEHRAVYQSFLWKTAHNIWVLAELLSQVIQCLSDEDWDSIEASLNEAKSVADALSANSAIDITHTIDSLTEMVSSRDALTIFRAVVDASRSIGISLDSEFPPMDEWGDMALEDSPGLNWRDIRYIYLFAIRYKLLSWWRLLGEEKNIEESISRLSTLLSILSYKTSMQSRLGGFSMEAENTASVDSIDSATLNLVTILKVNAGIS